MTVYHDYAMCLVGAMLFLLMTISLPVCSQQTNCQEYVREAKNAVKKSRTNLIFDVTEWDSKSPNQFIKGELEIDDGGLSPTIRFGFKFTDKGYSVASGDILTIHFEDGTRNEIIYSGKQSGSGRIVFTLIQAKDKSAVLHDDKVFYEKLKTLRIASFQLNVGNSNRVIEVSQFKSDLIRKIIPCLVQL